MDKKQTTRKPERIKDLDTRKNPVGGVKNKERA
jgi:hypothetical protein